MYTRMSNQYGRSCSFDDADDDDGGGDGLQAPLLQNLRSTGSCRSEQWMREEVLSSLQGKGGTCSWMDDGGVDVEDEMAVKCVVGFDLLLHGALALTDGLLLRIGEGTFGS